MPPVHPFEQHRQLRRGEHRHRMAPRRPAVGLKDDISRFHPLDGPGGPESELSRRAHLHHAHASVLQGAPHLHRPADEVSSRPGTKHRHPFHDRAGRGALRPHLQGRLHPSWPRPGALGQPLELRRAECGARRPG